MNIAGMKYSNDVPDHDDNPLYFLKLISDLSGEPSDDIIISMNLLLNHRN